jgi:hypothetical protein
VDGDRAGELGGRDRVQDGSDARGDRAVRQLAGCVLGRAAGVNEPVHEVDQIAMTGLAPHLCAELGEQVQVRLEGRDRHSGEPIGLGTAATGPEFRRWWAYDLA